eukprot:GHVH01006363.1.p1 GENE.GHVH01006363.1~~GHVH01006363.1.p1  ORF type:complete len:202 (+),score=18.37 GHVH01006363.1:72-608(+)
MGVAAAATCLAAAPLIDHDPGVDDPPQLCASNSFLNCYEEAKENYIFRKHAPFVGEFLPEAISEEININTFKTGAVFIKNPILSARSGSEIKKQFEEKNFLPLIQQVIILVCMSIISIVIGMLFIFIYIVMIPVIAAHGGILWLKRRRKKADEMPRSDKCRVPGEETDEYIPRPQQAC